MSNCRIWRSSVSFPPGSSGVSTFLALSDSPAAYTGQSLQGVRVNAGESALEFFTIPTGSTDELVKVDAGGTSDYLNPSFFERDGVNHIRTLERIDDAGTLTTKTWSADKISTELNLMIPITQKGAASGVVPLDISTKIDPIYLPASLTSPMIYRGAHDASTGAYPVGPSTGDVWVINVAGTIASIAYNIGDWIAYNGTSWDKIDNQNFVVSVNGQTGTVVLTKIDVSLGNVTDDSQLKRAGDDYSGFTYENVPDLLDRILIEDQSDSWNKKYTTLGDMVPALADGKIFAGQPGGKASAVTPSGDVTMLSSGAFTVAKIQNVAVESGTPGDGQGLVYNLSNNQYEYIDINSLPTGVQHQTLRHDGTSWVSDGSLTNEGGIVGINASGIIGGGASFTVGKYDNTARGNVLITELDTITTVARALQIQWRVGDALNISSGSRSRCIYAFAAGTLTEDETESLNIGDGNASIMHLERHRTLDGFDITSPAVIIQDDNRVSGHILDIRIDDSPADSVFAIGNTGIIYSTPLQTPAGSHPANYKSLYVDTDSGEIYSYDTPSGGGATWGSITGTLSSQTDLQTELDAKDNLITWKTFGSVTIISTTIFTVAGTSAEAAEMQGCLFSCTDSAGTTQRKGFIISASESSGTITVDVRTTTDLDLGGPDINFKYAPKTNWKCWEKYITIDGEAPTSTSTRIGMWHNYSLPVTIPSVSIHAITAAAGTGAALAINGKINGTTDIFATAPDLATANHSLHHVPTNFDLAALDYLAWYITNQGGATNYAADIQIIYTAIPTEIYDRA